MASQAAIFAETIAGMKKAIKRKAYDSDSEESIDHLTNRGNKLRKKARFVHEGQLAPPSGPEVYKRKIEHAGYQREIISRNPPLIDEDGYEVDSDDDDERAQAAMTAAAEFDPYSDVRIEHLLAPLSAAADLPNHPTLSIPFTSKTLTELTRQAGEMVQKEKASLWRIKHLLTRLSGDSTWIPCETVETDNDFALFIDEREPAQPNILEKAIARANGDQVSTGTMVSEDTEHVDRPLLIEGRPEDATMGDASHTVKHLATDGGTLMGSPSHMSDTEKAPVATSGTSKGEETTEQLQHNGLEATLNDSMEVDGTLQTSADEPILDQVEQAAEVELIDGEGDDAEVPAPRRMRTRAQAQAASDNNTSRSRSASSDSESETFIHPYFLTPASSRHDRNIGLPQPEADETRRLLQLYIQKQEEVCRGAQKVHEGLLKADRYRKLVMKWAKAEAHVGLNRDLSDGEDWYDKEEWGLDEDLKKGQDEEEEDAATTAKKTRTRRQ